MSAQSSLSAPVVVGVDGSASSLAAVDLAAEQARLRGCSLLVVHAFVWPYFQAPLGPSVWGPPEGGLRHQAEHVLAAAYERAQTAAPGAVVQGELVTGAPAAVLRECSRTASVVVVGDRGLGGFTGLLVGSVAVELAAHAHCPVLVARGTADPGMPVLLGVDGSPANDPAVGFAFEQAALRRVPLVALHAWAHPAAAGPGDMLPLVYDVDEVGAAEQRVLSEALAGWCDKYPDVWVERVVRHGAVRHGAMRHGAMRSTLIDATARAQLVVVGTRGRGGFTGLLLGSVSQAVLHHAACPVAVVPHHTPTDRCG